MSLQGLLVGQYEVAPPALETFSRYGMVELEARVLQLQEDGYLVRIVSSPPKVELDYSNPDGVVARSTQNVQAIPDSGTDTQRAATTAALRRLYGRHPHADSYDLLRHLPLAVHLVASGAWERMLAAGGAELLRTLLQEWHGTPRALEETVLSLVDGAR